MCIRCLKPAVSGAVQCSKCNNIAHKSCVGEDEAGEMLPVLRTYRHSGISTPSFYSFHRFVCTDCVESKRLELDWYNSEKARLEWDRIERIYATIIVRKARTYLTRRKYLVQKLVATIVQAIVRAHLARKRFKTYRRRHLRVFHLKLMDYTLDFKYDTANTMIIITVLDPSTLQQHFRCDSQLDRVCDKRLSAGMLFYFISLVSRRIGRFNCLHSWYPRNVHDSFYNSLH
jgi:hypothetical protein